MKPFLLFKPKILSIVVNCLPSYPACLLHLHILDLTELPSFLTKSVYSGLLVGHLYPYPTPSGCVVTLVKTLVACHVTHWKSELLQEPDKAPGRQEPYYFLILTDFLSRTHILSREVFFLNISDTLMLQGLCT